MKISPVEEYGLRCLIQIANHQGQGLPVNIRTISEMEGLSPAYVGKLLALLQKGGLVQGMRGAQGGYHLSREPKSISVGEVLRAMGEQQEVEEVCTRYTGQMDECVHAGSCGIRPVWARLSAHINGFLDKITLEDLSRQHQPLVKG